MSSQITMPKLGVEMDSARLAEWIVEEGAEVRDGEIIANLETDKVVFELPVTVNGYIHRVAATDDEYAIGDLLAVVAETADEYAAIVAGGGAPVGGSTAATEPAATPAATGNPPAVGSTDPGPAAPADAEAARDALAAGRRDGRPTATPVARRMAEAHGIDLRAVAGSGRRGVVRRRDVERAIAEQEQATTEAATAPVASGVPSPATAEDDTTVVKLGSMRRVIAQRMHDSLLQTAQMTDVREHDVSELVAFRRRAVEREQALGFRLSLTTLVARAAVLALRAAPELNATMPNADEIHRSGPVHLGMAVAVDDGLLVPVVRSADRLSLRELDVALREAIAAARERRAGAAELSGGTFTITNFGSYGSHFGTPVLNAPQVGILGVGALLDRAIVRDGEIVVGRAMHASLTVDHRAVDGEVAGRFQNELGRLFADPELLLYG